MSATSAPQSAPASGPLAGLRVIELGVLIAGPFCGQLLGDLGAEVIKIEPPGQPDPLREWGAVRPDGHGLWFSIIGRNKKCATLDLRKEDGQQVLKALIAKADIIIENFRPGTMEKWGLGYDELKKINPGIIMVRVSGYGQTGPASHKAGYAAVGEAMGGLRYLIGEPDRLPARAGISLGDTLAAIYAALGALAALEHRRRTGCGQVVDSAIYEACLAVTESLVPDYQMGGFVRERTGSFLPKIAPSNIYRSKDGMLIIAANQDSVFKRLAEAMGRPELAADPRYATHGARGDNQRELDELINGWAGAFTTDELLARCEEHAVPSGKIYRAPDMLDDPHYKAREAITAVRHAALGEIMMPNVFPKFSETPGAVRWAAPEPGQDNSYVYGSLLGYSAADISRLEDNGVI
ncbi:MAG: CoA transferase [Hyphomonadaceae bacterium]|nr:CoA transferase [Hyphomonadaceae bacterium]